MKDCQHPDQSIQESYSPSSQPDSTALTEFDPALLRLDLCPEAAFSLTRVVSASDYERLKESLLELKGTSYVFISLLDGELRLVLTVITASPDEVTATYNLDIKKLGIKAQDLEDIVASGGGCPQGGGVYPITPKIADLLRAAVARALDEGDWRFYEVL